MSQYNERFYDEINAGSLRSAHEIVPVVMGLLKPKVVVDFGCGEGAWLSVFMEHDCEVLGLDGSYVDVERLLIPKAQFVPMDLEHAFDNAVGVRCDLAMSLEVAEHLHESAADQFVDALCRAAPKVLFSAAIPGQGGTGHINEQWPDYWAEKFQARGYKVTGALRWQFWNKAPDPVENWYAQNLLLAIKEDDLHPDLLNLFSPPMATPFPVVHPVLWDARRR